jgi:UDP-N-acetylmuramate dehydrogenase
MTTIDGLVKKGAVSVDVPLGPLTTYKSGGAARYYADLEDEQALVQLVESGALQDLPVLVLGRGSNLVVADKGFPGLVVKLGSGFSSISIEETTVTAGGAASLARLARSSVEAGLSGLEFFVGIPGSVGGAIRQNAGCFGTETKDRLSTARMLDLTSGLISRRSSQDLDLSYRHSNLETTDLVLSASFHAAPGDIATSRAELRRITRWRRDHQPGGTFNAGSVFKNPKHIPAGELIDSLGLKGMSEGDVAISHKHANFFVAGPDATSEDIHNLVAAVKDRVFELSGTILEPEIQFVGFEE